MAGSVQESSDDEYRAACCEIADRLGFSAGEVFFFWSQLWMMRVRETQDVFRIRLDRSVAKFLALHDVETALNKRGAGLPS